MREGMRPRDRGDTLFLEIPDNLPIRSRIMMSFPTVRMRRTRQNEKLRGLVRESHLNVEQLIYPLFIAENIDEPRAISSMPRIVQCPLEYLRLNAERIARLGIPPVLLFCIPADKAEAG